MRASTVASNRLVRLFQTPFRGNPCRLSTLSPIVDRKAPLSTLTARHPTFPINEPVPTTTIRMTQRHFSSGLNGKANRSPDDTTRATGADIMASFGDRGFDGNDVASAMEALAYADAVCFDVDSTVISEEGIDVLAESLGKGEIVSEWTAKAMTGNVKFEDALAARLDIIRPSRKAIEDCLRDHPLVLSPGIDTLIEALNRRGTDVYLVSGGFRIMIEPIAKEVMVAKDRIYANTILFDGAGEYAGFDDTEPTSADGGKPKALQKIKEEFGYERMVMVGDGATDAQARPPADAFIGYGGVVVRESVKAQADWFVMDFEDMIKISDHLGQWGHSSNSIN